MQFINLFTATLMTFFASQAIAESTIVVTHPAIPAPTFLDLGKTGQSIGDIRIWHFPAKADNGGDLMTDWIMTTTGIVENKKIEYRIMNAVFSFGDGTKDQITIQGIGQYSSLKEALDESAVTRRAITGGTGKFANSIGWVETMHLKDGSWKHTLYLK